MPLVKWLAVSEIRAHGWLCRPRTADRIPDSGSRPDSDGCGRCVGPATNQADRGATLAASAAERLAEEAWHRAVPAFLRRLRLLVARPARAFRLGPCPGPGRRL